MRTCKSCLSSKNIIDFHHYSKDNPSRKCKECHTRDERNRQKALWANSPEYRQRHNEYGKLVRRGEKPPSKPVHMRGNERVCKSCQTVRLTIEFPLRGTNRLRTCTTCYNDRENLKARERYREDAEYRAKKKLNGKKARLKYKYGVTVEELLKTLESQHGKCANKACGVDISLTAPKELVKPAVVDHDHASGKFRALLCTSCNTLLGRIEKDKKIVDSLFDYLDEHKIISSLQRLGN